LLCSLPAAPETVAAFLAAEADAGRAVSTVRRRAAAIRLAHRLCDCESPTAAETVRGTLRGIARTRGSAPHQKAPALAEEVRAMVDCLDLATLGGLRDRALLTLGFGGAFRRGELAALTVADLTELPGGWHVRVRSSKTDPEGAGQIVPVVRGGTHCPVRAVRAWIDAAGLRDGALLRRLYRGGRVSERGLTGHSVAAVVRRCAAQAGLDPAQYAGHSLRAGFLTSAAAGGASLPRIMAVSRHRDPRNAMRYIRPVDDFLDHAGAGLL
jgi:integrase